MTSLLTFAVNQKHNKMVTARDKGKGINAFNESAIVSRLKKIPPKSLCPFNINTRSPYPPKSM